MNRPAILFALIWSTGVGAYAWWTVSDKSLFLLLLLAVPVALAAAPLAVPRRAQSTTASIAAALTLVWACVSIMTVGLFYLPCFIALAIGGTWYPHDQAKQPKESSP